MALGGGTWITQNKTLPGSYINFISAARATSILSERGVATMPLELDWGVDGEVFEVTARDFEQHSLRIFGYDFFHDKMRELRELFKNIKSGYFYKLNSDGTKATNTHATALHSGVRGNDLTIVIEYNEASESGNEIYDVSTFFAGRKMDTQTVKTATELIANNFVEFKGDATLALTAGTPLTGGTSGAVVDADYQTYCDAIEPYSFNTLGCATTSVLVKTLMINFTKRMRDEVGAKFQTVLFRAESADFEGVISLENGLVGDDDSTALVYWVTGASAACPVNASLTNKPYTGEYNVNTRYTNAELEACIKSGKFVLHSVNSDVRVLEDINTFTSFTENKSADFASNQIIRVLDQIGNDIALLFNTKYLGEIPNDQDGRISLWADIVRHHQDLQTIRAIEGFSGDMVTVEQGETKRAVMVRDYVTPTNAMSQLYMVVVVN
jgi:Phage tail sheath protein.